MQSAESLSASARGGWLQGSSSRCCPPPGPLLKEACVRDEPSLAYTCPAAGGDSRAAASLPGSPSPGPQDTHPGSLGLMMPWACSWGPLPTEAFASSPHLCPHPAGLIVPSPRPRHPHSRPCLLRVLQTHPNPSTNHTRPLMHSLSVHLPDDVVSISPAAHTSPCQLGPALQGA